MESYFHVGFIVADLEQAMAEFGRARGLSWAEPMEFALGAQTARAIYSRAAPYIELIDGSPGSHWGEFEGAPRMHLGYWSEDVEGDTQRAIDAGATMVFDLREFGLGSTLLTMASGIGIEYADAGYSSGLQQALDQPGT